MRYLNKYVFRLNLWAATSTPYIEISKVCVHHQNNNVLSTNNRHSGHSSRSLIFTIGHFWFVLSHFTLHGLL